MSIFYNIHSGVTGIITRKNEPMNSIKRISTLAAIALAATLFIVHAGRADDPPAPAKTAPEPAKAASPLEPLAFLVGGEWKAKLPGKPDGPQAAIIARFSWAQNHRAIRISNSFVVGDKSMPYIDGMYLWHPGKKTVVFSYIDAEGSLSEGTVKSESGVLLHEFQETDEKGAVSQFTARVTPLPPDAWDNEIFARKDGHLEPLVKVHYERVK